MNYVSIIAALAGLVAGVIASYFAFASISSSILKKAKSDAENIKAKANEELAKSTEKIELDKRRLEIEIREYKNKIEREFDQRKLEMVKKEENIRVNELMVKQRVEGLNKKENDIENTKNKLEDYEKSIAQKDEEVNKRASKINEEIEKYRQKLESVANMTREQAKKELVGSLVDVAKREAEQLIREIKDRAQDDAKREAKRIVSLAIQKCAVDHTVENTVTVVNLPSDEMKGRIIGRTGRNIRAFESATGVDVIVDDTPEAVVLSSFDPIRREIAKMTLESLITDGRIHPSRIEELIEKSEKEIAEIIKETGQQTVLDMGILGLHPELVKLLGKLKYRTSYGQNVLQHSIEVGYLCSLMATELGFDANIAKRVGVLHDIGKAVDREVEGTHAAIGAELAAKYGEKDVVVNAIESHHEETEAMSIYAVLAQAGDSISSSRPGARRETLETYIKRVKKLEEIATSFEGVNNGYAVQAGREIRVIVEPDKVDDARSLELSKEIAKRIQEEMQYPGTIKVNVIREVRYSEYAK